MKQFVNFVLVTFLVFASGVMWTEEANPASDFVYDLNEEGTGVVIKKYKGKAVDVVIPSVIEDFPVVELGGKAFSSTNIVSVVIPDSITRISGYDDLYGYKYGAFKNCESLQKVRLPKNLKSIDDYVFYGCSSLKEITLPEELESIGVSAFSSSGLESITISDGVDIKKYAFYECENLKTVSIGNSMKCIGEKAFYQCKNLETVSIGNDVQVIGVFAFYECKNLTTVNIGDGVQHIGCGAFVNCSNLTTFNIGANKLNEKGGFYINDSNDVHYSYGYNDGYDYSSNDAKYVFSGCSSLSLKERKKIRDTGYKGGF